MDSSSLPNHTDDVIEGIVQALCDEMAWPPHVRHIYRESLRNLVRLAKAEQLQEMQDEGLPPARLEDWRVLH